MNEDKSPLTPSEDDLLANAIPIDSLEEEEELPPTPVIEVTARAEDAIDMDSAQAPKREIRTFDTHAHKDVDSNWKRKPSTQTRGATHLRTFVSKLRMDAVEHLDAQVNQWLDEHPEYEVKFATITTGVLTGKLREEALFLNVWV